MIPSRYRQLRAKAARWIRPTQLEAHDKRPGAPAEGGRLVDLFRAVDEGRTPLAHARLQAAEAGVQGDVMPAQMELLAEAAFQQATAVDANRRAWTLALLVHDAAKGAWSVRRDRDVGTALIKASAELIDASHLRLEAAGDRHVWEQAMSAAQAGVAVALELDMPQQHGWLLQRRGSLVLDCYTAGRSPAAHALEFQHWVEKAMFSADPNVSQGQGHIDARTRAASLPWPPALVAMDMAEADLRAALPMVSPERRGRVLMSLTQVLRWRTVFGGAWAPDELVGLCRAALAELAPHDTHARSVVAEALRRASTDGREAASVSSHMGADGADVLDETVDEIEARWDALVRRLGPLHAWDLVAAAARGLAARDPARALRILVRQRSLDEVWTQETRRSSHLTSCLHIAATAAAPTWTSGVWSNAPAFDTITERVLAAADPGRPESLDRLSPREAMGALALVMMASTKFDRERAGLRALKLLPSNHVPEWDDQVDSFRHITALLHQAEAVNLERSGQRDAAVRMYLKAADWNLQTGFANAVVVVLHYVADLVEDGGLGELSSVSAWCAVNSLRLELLCGAEGQAAMLRLVAVTLAAQTERGTTLELVQQLLHAAKARRFGAMLRLGAGAWLPDDTTRGQLAAESLAAARRRGEADAHDYEAWDALLDQEELLTAYVTDFEISPSDTPAGQLANLQRAIERRIMTQLAAFEPTGHLPASLTEIQAALDPWTAVLQMYEGTWTDGRLATFLLLLTDTVDHLSIRLDDRRAGAVRAVAAGREVQVPAGGFYVSAVRREVQEEPGLRDVSKLGEELLAGAAERYAAPVLEHLQDLRATGKDRLVVIAHGATHLLPIHLVGPAGSPLGDEWTVSFLLGAASLTSASPEHARPGRSRRAVFALGYRDHPHLTPLVSSATEGRAIAEILGVEPVLDEAATASAFRRAVETCRYVHLRAHGRHNLDAPLFHLVYLAPTQGHDGRLHAHEVLPMDLHGLELITLGACETSLGRVDVGDNPRGLPAALLLAGAAAVIGTLWEVVEDVSTTFFTHLYRRLEHDGDDVVTAFASAQREARKHHPQYRDWGAFTLTERDYTMRAPT